VVGGLAESVGQRSKRRRIEAWSQSNIYLFPFPTLSTSIFFAITTCRSFPKSLNTCHLHTQKPQPVRIVTPSTDPLSLRGLAKPAVDGLLSLGAGVLLLECLHVLPVLLAVGGLGGRQTSDIRAGFLPKAPAILTCSTAGSCIRR
jgi:hypothetical protein